jgi:hypothetical protein
MLARILLNVVVFSFLLAFQTLSVHILFGFNIIFQELYHTLSCIKHLRVSLLLGGTENSSAE